MIWLTGDTHGDFSRFSLENFPEQKELTREDYVIILGDFGGLWTGTEYEKKILNQLAEKDFNILFIDGNHENFDLLDTFPVVEFRGGLAHKIRDNIFHLMRGFVFTLDNKKFFAFGGGSSIDKHIRKEGVSWWPQELQSPLEEATAKAELDKVDWTVDYVLTHTCPTAVSEQLFDELYPDSVSEFLESLEDLKFKRWFFGHMHLDMNVNNLFTGLYMQFVQIL